MIIYLTMDGLHSSPFVSQVLGYVAPLAGAGVDIRLITWTRITNDRKALVDERAETTRRALGDKARFFERGRNLGPITRKVMVRDIKRALKEWIVQEDEPILFHARSPWTGLAALKMRSLRPGSRVITDFRGTMTAEAKLVLENSNYALRIAGKLWLYESEKAERICAQQSDHVLCVSNAFKRLLVERYDLAENRVSVVPCFVDTKKFAFDPNVREKVRSEFGIGNGATVLLYCGTLRYYSKNEEIFRIFRKIKESGKDAVFLMITPDKELAEEAAQNAGVSIDDLRIVCGGHEDVARWLQAGDLAFLLRDQDEVNLVACPMKFAEYIRSGVKTVVTPGIGDLADFIEGQNAGWIHTLSSGLPEGLGESYGNIERKRISDAAARVFGQDRHLPNVRELYSELGV